MTASPLATHSLTPSRDSSMPRPSTLRVSDKSRSNSPSPQPTSRTLAPCSTMSATTTRSTRAPPGMRAASAMVRSCLRRESIIIAAPSSSHRRQAARLRGTIEKAAHDGEQLRLLQQEGVVALVGDDLGERDARAAGIERMHDGARIKGRKQPVRGEGDHAETGGRILERARQHAVEIRRQVEIIHSAGEIQIGIGVEPLHEADALVAQIALDLEIGIEREGRIVAVLEL